MLIRVALFSSCTLFMLHLFACCTFSCCTFFRVASCCTHFMLHYLRVTLYLCCTFFVLSFFMLHSLDVALFSVLQTYPVPLFTYYIFSVLYSFHVALFSVLHSFHIAPSFVMHCSNFFVFFVCVCVCVCVLFHVTSHLNIAVLSSCTFVMFYLFIYFFSYWSLFDPKLFLCCTHVTPFFVLHCFDLVPFLLSFHVAPFLCCTLSCCTFFVLASLHIALFLFCIYPPLGLFSCCNFFMLHFFHYGLSLLFCKKQNSFYGDLSLLLFLTMHTFHIALVHFMFHFFLVSYFSCCTLYIIPLHRA